MTSPRFSADEVRAQIAALGRLSGQDEADLLDVELGELQTLLQTYRDAAAPADKTAWDEAIVVIGYMAQVAGPVATIASAFVGIFGVAAAASKL